MRKNAPENLMDHRASKHGENLISIMSCLPEGGLKKDLPYKIRPKSDTQIVMEDYGGISHQQLLLEILEHQVLLDAFTQK